MSDALWGAIGTIIGASIVGITTYLSQRQARLMADCRSAIKDLKRFRQLEDKRAEELSSLKPGASPGAERKRVRRLLSDKIGQYGQPARIDKLLDRLG